VRLVNSIAAQQGGVRLRQIIGGGWKIKGQGDVVMLDSAVAWVNQFNWQWPSLLPSVTCSDLCKL